jgi:hypothetical protein
VEDVLEELGEEVDVREDRSPEQEHDPAAPRAVAGGEEPKWPEGGWLTRSTAPSRARRAAAAAEERR